MKIIAVYLLFTFSIKIYCEQRQLLFSRVNIVYCSVNCCSEIFCVGFGFNTNSKHCFEVHAHDFEREGLSYQPVPTRSDELFWYHSGNK